MTQELATLGGGCFWCLEAAFLDLRGVTGVTPGYAGGHTNHPAYRDVCSGSTGHAEVVQIEFDSDAIDFRTLLEVFFSIHDPTTLNRQGADVGSQYRSVVFYHDEQQHSVAIDLTGQLSDEGIWRTPIVTQLEPLAQFFPAEKYHHNYYRQNSSQGYCQVVIEPKLAKLRALRADLVKA